MPDTAAGAAAAAAASGASAAAEGAEGSRHRHRVQQGDTERPEPGAAPPPASSGVLGESCASFRSGRCGLISGRRKGGQVQGDHRTAGRRAAAVFCLHQGVPNINAPDYAPINNLFNFRSCSQAVTTSLIELSTPVWFGKRIKCMRLSAVSRQAASTCVHLFIPTKSFS